MQGAIRACDESGGHDGAVAADPTNRDSCNRGRTAAATVTGWFGIHACRVGRRYRHLPEGRGGLVAVPAGVGVFAVFYAVTQGIERLLEPISALVYKTKDAVTERNRKLAQALSPVPAGDRQTAIQQAADAQAMLDQRRADRAVIFWAVATVLAMAVSAALGLYLLHAVGLPEGGWRGGPFSAQGLRRWVDLLVTGLAVGGGTKPLHDLISNLQASKEAKKDPPQVISS